MQTPTIPNPMIPNQMVVAPAERETKTVDYRINVSSKAGDVRSAGILKLWKRFDETQQAALVAILSTSESVVEITPMSEEATTGVKDEF